MKKLVPILLSATLALGLPLSVSAAELSPKEEIVYGILNSDGSIGGVFVVNILTGGGALTDFGNYVSVRNMNTTDPITQSGGAVSVTTSANRLYYEGTLDNAELPWDITVTYALDGKAVTASEIAGLSGALEIGIKASQNPDVNPFFFENYALQITLGLNAENCQNIVAEGATIAQVGKKTQMVYTILPGKGAELNITANVTDFEMDAITINGLKLNLNIDTSASETELTGKTAELADAIAKLRDGASGLRRGGSDLSDGINKYVDNLKTYRDSMSRLNSSMNSLTAGASAMKSGIADLSAKNAALNTGADQMLKAVFAAANAQLKTMGAPEVTPENYATVLSISPMLEPIKAQLDSALQFCNGVKAYTGGVAALGKGADELVNGANTLKTGISQLNDATEKLYNAGFEIADAAKKLKEGLTTYENGVNELYDKTNDIDTQITSKVNELIAGIMGTSDEVKSFMSDKNTNVTAVQFALRTDAIKIPSPPAVEAAPPVKMNFFQKLLNLFR